MVKLMRIFDGLPYTLTIFYVTRVITDSGVKNIVHCVFPKKQVANNSHSFPISVVSPKSP